MIYVISKATYGEYNVRDIQCNANWSGCPYSDYARIPDDLVDPILSTKGYCDITLTANGTMVESFVARPIPPVLPNCASPNNVALRVNGVNANGDGEVLLLPKDIGAAPAGYGLGETILTYADDMNDLSRPTGWYWMNEASVNRPIWFNQGILHMTQSEGNVHLEAYDVVNGYRMHWWSADGADWEYENPPMAVGAEFRTTERCNGYPVFKKMLAFTPSSFSAQKIAFPHGISGLTMGLSIEVVWKYTDASGVESWRTFPAVYYSNLEWAGQAYFKGSDNIEFELGATLRSNMAKSTENIYVTLKYTRG